VTWKCQYAPTTSKKPRDCDKRHLRVKAYKIFKWPRIGHDQMRYCVVVTGQEINSKYIDRVHPCCCSAVWSVQSTTCCLTSASHLPIFVPIWLAARTATPSKLSGIRGADLIMRKRTTWGVTTAALAATGPGADGRDCRNIGTYGREIKFGADLEQVQIAVQWHFYAVDLAFLG